MQKRITQKSIPRKKGMSNDAQQKLVEQYLDGRDKPVLISKQEIVLVGIDACVPVRNQTSFKQEKSTFDIIWNCIMGTPVPENHMLQKYSKDYLVKKAKAEYGLTWYYDVLSVYSAFCRSRVSLLNLIEWECYADDSWRSLFRRYKTEQELLTIFRWPSMTSIHGTV